MPFNRKTAEFMLKDVYTAADEAGLSPFLIQGQVLGAVRDGGFTPSEKDLDIGVWGWKFPHMGGRFLANLVNRGYEIETRHRTFPGSRATHTVVVYHGLTQTKCDVVGFFLNKTTNDMYAVTPNDPVNVPRPYAIVHPRELLERRRNIELFGQTYSIPGETEADTERYLEREYGPDWRTPRDDHVSRARVYNYLKLNGLE